ncbi:MAG: asparagine synthase (glutamine-hydrolyzing) [bacterium]|nr:asparagine synthase (glutamine-hydrolyzing) [bacterium]
MCGINGFNFGSEELIRKMNACVKHRGPDGDGVFVCNNISLGHTRLAIIDLSEKAAQPMISADESLVLIFNGEIYNFQEIRDELKIKGYKFRSDSDSEVIIHSYKEYGVGCLQKFNGIFAFAIFDKKDGSLFIARDRIGVKPLYYYWNNDKLIFSSEIKSILEHDIERELDLDALNIYFRALYVPAPLTMFKSIKKLEPASYLIYKNNKLEIKKYWQPTDFKDFEDKEETTKKIFDTMKDSVRLQMISDRPVGVFLSGGIDSTIITGLAQELSKEKLKTFSVRFDVDSPKYNTDADLANKTSEHYGTDHNEFLVSGRDALENLHNVIYHMDEPVSNTTQIATYLLSKYASQDVVVALGGDGADELFGGYERYRLSGLISKYQNIPEFIRNSVGALAINFCKNKYPSAQKLNLPPNASRYLSFMAQKEDEVDNILKKEVNNGGGIEKFYQEKYFKSKDSDFEKLFMWADTRSWLPDESLIRSDKMSMAFGLEQRVPILDHRLVELSLKIPTSWKIEGKNKKAIFKEAFKDYLPDYILNQPKRGWFSPTSTWLRVELKDLAYEVLSPNYNVGTKEYFDFDKIKVMLDDHINGRAYHMNILWAIITFQIWYKTFIHKPNFSP